MKKLISISFLFAALTYSSFALAGANNEVKATNNVVKEGDEVKKKTTTNKYSFTLFSFFDYNTSSKTDSSTVKEKEVLAPAKAPAKTGL